MSVIGHLCGLDDVTQYLVLPSAEAIRGMVAVHADLALVEPDLPIGKLPLPKDPIDRAVLAILTRDQPRHLAFVRGGKHRLARVKVERALDLVITRRSDIAFEGLAVEPISGKDLLRRVRELRGTASTSDASELGKALVRAWSDGTIDLSLR